MIILYEEFENKTLSKNIDKYNTYLNNINRSNMVAWEAIDSQKINFKLVANYIKNGDSVLDYGCGIGDFIIYLEQNNINISNYLGVDINDNYIKIAKDTYKNYNFQVINNINQINEKWDNVCAIGVFTWYITEKEFKKTIEKLYDLCNKRVLLTFLYGITPYKKDWGSTKIYWNSEYRYYDEDLFDSLFPDLNISYEYYDRTMLVKIEK